MAVELKKWQVLSSEVAFQNRWWLVHQDRCQLPNGRIIDDYFVRIARPIVMIIALTREREVVLVRQYRHGVRDILTELPAGYVEHGEDVLTAARRELQEETGFEAEEMIEIGRLVNDPTASNNFKHVFLAPNATPTSHQTPDPTEEIEVITAPLPRFREMLSSGEINCSGCVAAGFLGLAHLESAV